MNLTKKGLKDCRKEREQPQQKLVSETVEKRVVKLAMGNEVYKKRSEETKGNKKQYLK